MNRRKVTLPGAMLLVSAWTVADEPKPGQTPKPYVQKQDVLYGEIHGTGLLMDVFTPAGESNGLGIVDVASGAWNPTAARFATTPGSPSAKKLKPCRTGSTRNFRSKPTHSESRI